MSLQELVFGSKLPGHEARRLGVVAAGQTDPESTFRRLEASRLGGEPLQYLEGSAAFGPLELAVDERVLIPRPETEQLWDLSRELVPEPSLVVDLCTGSGALALAWKLYAPKARVLGTDLSVDALAVAAANAVSLGLEVEWCQGDLFAALPAELKSKVDLLIVNPPYVGESVWPALPDDVRREPRLALVSGPTGLEVLERLAAGVADWLTSGGWLACEIGETQGADCSRLFGSSLEAVEVRADLAGRPRFVVGRQP